MIYSPVCSRIEEQDGDKVYQGAVLSNYRPSTLDTCATQVLAYVNKLEKKMRARLEWSDVKMLRAILVLLDIQSWCCSPSQSSSNHSGSEEEEDDLTEIREAVEYITSHFREPLVAKSVCLVSLQDEIEVDVLYARKHLGISREGHQKIWYKLHIAPDAGK